MGVNRMRAVWVGAAAVLAASAALALAQQTAGTAWISAGTTGVLPAQAEFPTPTGRVGLLLSGGLIEMKGHPFFTQQFGTNADGTPRYGVIVLQNPQPGTQGNLGQMTLLVLLALDQHKGCVNSGLQRAGLPPL
jgi:hypothetical protein